MVLEGLREPRGEYTLVIHPATLKDSKPQRPSREAMLVEFGVLTKNGRGERREALRLLAKKYGIPTRELYNELIKTRQELGLLTQIEGRLAASP